MSYESPNFSTRDADGKPRLRARIHSVHEVVDPVQKLLAPGMTWEEVAKKHSLSVDKAQRIVQAFVQYEDFAWLKGRVGGGKKMMEEHRGVILAANQFHKD